MKAWGTFRTGGFREDVILARRAVTHSAGWSRKEPCYTQQDDDNNG